MSINELKNQFILHWHVWFNEHAELDAVLSKGVHNIDMLDPRGRTPLLLAVVLGHIESARVLLKYNADATFQDKNYWSIVHEATSTSDPELVSLILQHRNFQRERSKNEHIPDLLKILNDSPDFYVEMKWEFSSWVPLVSRVCPSDTYRVWKSGSKVRIDTTLIGFDNMKWIRGNRSCIFRATHNGAEVLEIDHENRSVQKETLTIEPIANCNLIPSEDAIATRLTSPIVTTFIDIDNISFERSKCGIWGWRSNKTETIDGLDCKVFSASNVEILTHTRTEHLTEMDKKLSKSQNQNFILNSILGAIDKEDKVLNQACESENDFTNPSHITPEEYFNKDISLNGRDIGRPKELKTKKQSFKATLWLSEDFPLNLQEQVQPIIDLMAVSNAHFQKLKDFITLQLPSGFPVKIEIPIFHVINTKITFGNIHALKIPVQHVSSIKNDTVIKCKIDDSVFQIADDYENIGSGLFDGITGGYSSDPYHDEDDELLKFAIQQSLVSGSEIDKITFLEALDQSKPKNPAVNSEYIDRDLQRALEASLTLNHDMKHNTDIVQNEQTPTKSFYNDDLKAVLDLSVMEKKQIDERLLKEEEELERVLKLSLTEK